jgi:hypothetical protein
VRVLTTARTSHNVVELLLMEAFQIQRVLTKVYGLG